MGSVGDLLVILPGREILTLDVCNPGDESAYKG